MPLNINMPHSIEIIDKYKNLWQGIIEGKSNNQGNEKDWTLSERIKGLVIGILVFIPLGFTCAFLKAVEYFKDRNITPLNSPASKESKVFKNTFNDTPHQEENEVLEKTYTQPFNHREWGKKTFSKPAALAKMIKNQKKAILEQVKYFKAGYGNRKHCFANIKDLNLDKIDITKTQPPLNFESGVADSIGLRKSMEDAHFEMTLPTGVVYGVFDGHGGKEVADFASKRFQELFPKILIKNEQNVHQSFEEVFLQIQEEIISQNQFDSIGSTAVISYIEKKSNLVYTATLSDSEANIYRKINGQWKSIPLSCVRDWESEKDEKRADEGTKDEYTQSVLATWIKKNIPGKFRRISQKYKNCKLKYNECWGNNISRAFGDQILNIDRPIILVIAKPKITVCPILPGDILILACDGLKDYVPENEIIQEITLVNKKSPTEICKGLVARSLNNQNQARDGDNVTIIAVKIKN